jgi:hypothetical protein
MSLRVKKRKGDEEHAVGFEPHAVVFRVERVELVMHDPVRKKALLVFESGTKVAFGCRDPEGFAALTRSITASKQTGWTVYAPKGEYTNVMDLFGNATSLPTE